MQAGRERILEHGDWEGLGMEQIREARGGGKTEMAESSCGLIGRAWPRLCPRGRGTLTEQSVDRKSPLVSAPHPTSCRQPTATWVWWSSREL